MKTGKITILIADDEQELLQVLRDSLEQDDLEILTTANGLEAIELINRQVVDLVITDLMMPGADGLEVLRAAKAADPDTLVIIITGHASLETAIQAVREGAYDYIRKPFRLEELNLVVSNASERIRLIWENKFLLAKLRDAYGKLQALKVLANSAPEVASGASELIFTRTDLSLLPKAKQGGQELLDNLEQMGRLKEKEILSEEEFELCKRSLLKKL